MFNLPLMDLSFSLFFSVQFYEDSKRYQQEAILRQLFY
jgi:hypothetical protein